MATLSLKNIGKKYPNGFEAVTDFNLEVKSGEFIVFVGPSGCGKSTTLRMIAGLESITSGEFHIEERLVNDVAPKDRDIAMVFQSYALYPHMSVYDNMAFALKLSKMPKDEIDARVTAVGEMLGLTPLLNRKPKALSGGQRQRVALGRSVVREPKVFLMDEPLSNLDAKLRGHMRAEIIKIHKRVGATTIYVTHDQVEAMTMADRIVVMKDGIVQQIDTPKNLYDYPVNQFVAGFIGSPSMNFMTVLYENGHIVVDGQKVEIPKAKGHILDENGYNGKNIVIGIRPEDISTSELIRQTYPSASFEKTVDFAELLGSEYNLHLEVASTSVIATIPARIIVESGSNVTVTFDMNKMHFFDAETEMAI
jgi:ABC-type sugar transport systems, ATPase components